MLVLSTILTAGVAELLIRKAVLPLPDYFESSGWWNEHWQRKQRGGMPRRFVKLDPDLGWVPAPNLDRLPYEGAELSTNSVSIRGRREDIPGPSERTRIVAIGDSLMFGQCLDNDETGPARLEAHLPGTEVVNLGVMGYGHGQMLLRLRRDGLAYEPDLVVLGFHRWDITRNRLEFRDYAKPRFVLDDGELHLTNAPVPDPDHYARRTLRVANYLRMLWDVFRKDELAAEDRELTLALTRAIAEESAAAGARFALVYLPVQDEVEDDPIPLDFLAAECAAQGWLCIGPAPRILETWPKRRHYSAPLANLIAGLTAERIQALWPELFSDALGRSPARIIPAPMRSCSQWRGWSRGGSGAGCVRMTGAWCVVAAVGPGSGPPRRSCFASGASTAPPCEPSARAPGWAPARSTATSAPRRSS